MRRRRTYAPKIHGQLASTLQQNWHREQATIRTYDQDPGIFSDARRSTCPQVRPNRSRIGCDDFRSLSLPQRPSSPGGPLLFARRSYPNRFNHRAAWASLGMRQSPRGDKLTEPTFGPSGRQERLNWLAKKRVRKTLNHF
jgi:hypothetical protein